MSPRATARTSAPRTSIAAADMRDSIPAAPDGNTRVRESTWEGARMSWLTGQTGDLWIVAAKAALMYLVAVLGLRVAQRRTLAQWTAIDFAASVAIGAIMGRTAVATGQSFVIGAVALLTILATHALVMLARFNTNVAKLVDHRVRVLVDHGQLRTDQLR